MRFFNAKYRIVTDRYAGYEAQVKYWYWPFWSMVNGINTNPTVEVAEQLIRSHKSEREFKKEVVKIIDS